jgi:hypothetical protein
LLHLNNGEELGKKLRDENGRLTRLLKTSKDDSQISQGVFLASLNRPPTEKELAALQRALSSGDKRDEVYRDLFWAVLNSKEFAFNH